MNKSERQEQISEMVLKNGSIDIKDLSRIFGVTEMTIRRDLETLEEKHIIVRTKGGAASLPENVLSENAYELRIARHIKEKEAIARLALSLIHDGDKVFLDSSTTVYCIAKMLKNNQDFLIVTDTLTTALEANKRKNIKVICLGGEVKKSTNSCVSLIAEQAIETMNFTTAFFSAPLVSLNGYVSLSSISELSIKKKIMCHAKKNILLFDSSKLGSPDFLNFAKISSFDIIITDSNIDPEFLKICKETNTDLMIAPVAPHLTQL